MNHPASLIILKNLTEYLKDVQIAGMLVAYHGAGATFLPDVPKYATRNAIEYSEKGGGKALVENFAGAFGEIFDASIHNITNVVTEGRITVGGIEFEIKQTAEAFDIVIPEINAVYTHMLGHDCHSIVAGAGHADGIIAELKSYIQKGLRFDPDLALHAGRFERTRKPKIDYLENLKKIAAALCGRRQLQSRGTEAVPCIQRPELSGYDGRIFLRLI